jgi:hypothetical protein
MMAFEWTNVYFIAQLTGERFRGGLEEGSLIAGPLRRRALGLLRYGLPGRGFTAVINRAWG